MSARRSPFRRSSWTAICPTSGSRHNLRFLFLSPHRPGRAPNQRFRFEQYLPDLRSRGVECEHSWLLDADDDAAYYARGRPLRKAWIAARGLSRRLWETRRSRLDAGYKLVMVVREAYFAGGAFLERRIARSRARLVFDFDDAIWLPAVSVANRRFAWLKSAPRVADAVRAAEQVLAGNAYLADWARQYNERVAVVPTTIDTDEYQVVAQRPAGQPVCIGWSGSFSTLPHFETAIPALRRVHERLGERVRFKVIGGAGFSVPELAIEGQPWRLDRELTDLSEIDIGIMPLPDDEWSRGKCGLKGLQYMALGIPTLMSPVGVNAEIVQDGTNGFLPRSEDEWVERLVTLVEAPDLRNRLGLAGRATVEARYSLRAWRERYHCLLAGTAEGTPPIGRQRDAA